jgi:hypothetical protein
MYLLMRVRKDKDKDTLNFIPVHDDCYNYLRRKHRYNFKFSKEREKVIYSPVVNQGKKTREYVDYNFEKLTH